MRGTPFLRKGVPGGPAVVVLPRRRAGQVNGGGAGIFATMEAFVPRGPAPAARQRSWSRLWPLRPWALRRSAGGPPFFFVHSDSLLVLRCDLLPSRSPHSGRRLWAGALSRNMLCRFTVGLDLVGTSGAEGERVSPQRASVASDCCIADRPLGVQRFVSHPPTRGAVLIEGQGARLSVTRWCGACQPCACMVCG